MVVGLGGGSALTNTISHTLTPCWVKRHKRYISVYMQRHASTAGLQGKQNWSDYQQQSCNNK